MNIRPVDIECLLGLTLKSITKIRDSLTFTTIDNRKFKMYHEQDCCEDVEIEDIVGDLDDLIGTPILFAEKSTNYDNPRSINDESFTWTFYKLATIKGWVDIRWYGASNGYYGESASIVEYL